MVAPNAFAGETYADTRAHVENLIAQYLWAFDTQDDEAFASLFAADGEVVMTAELEVACSGGEYDPGSFDYHGTWTLNATVNPDLTVTIAYTGGDFHWTQTVECTEGQAVPGWNSR
jgi:hypothetical protein